MSSSAFKYNNKSELLKIYCKIASGTNTGSTLPVSTDGTQDVKPASNPIRKYSLVLH